MSENLNNSIDLLQKDEVEHFKEIYLSALENNWKTLEGHNDRERWESNFRQWIRNEFTIMVLKVDDNIIGYITGDPSRILHIWVHENYRRESFGKNLINKFLEYQHEKGFNKFTLKAYTPNVPFFKNVGFCINYKSDEFVILETNKYG